MKRPVLISIMAVVSMATAIWLAAMFTYSFAQVARFDQPRDQAGFLLGLVVCFLIGAVSVGLWNLDPGARRAVLLLITPFVMAANGIFIAEVARTTARTLLNPDLWSSTMLTLLGDLLVIYLNLPRVRRRFQQLDLVLLNLH
jgi:hypothetical protein